MKKTAKTSLRIAIALFITLSVSTFSWAMKNEGKEEVGTENDTVTLISSDGVSFSNIPQNIANLSVTIKDTLEDLGSQAEVPLPLTASTLKSIIALLEGTKKIQPRKIDGKQSPYKIQEVVDKQLKTVSFEQIKDIFKGVDYLAIESLMSPMARALAYNDPLQTQEIIRLLKDGAKSEIEIAKISGIAPESARLFEHHLALESIAAPFKYFTEYSIADLIEEDPKKITVDSRGSLNIFGLNTPITSLDGLNLLNEAQKEKIKNIILIKNRLTDIENDAFKGFTNLQEISLYGNRIKNISTNAFRGLDKLQHLTLSENKLTAMPIVNGLANLDSLILDNNQLENIEIGALEEFTNLKTLVLSNNNITSIPYDLAKKLPNLNFLNLDGNKLCHIPNNIFQGFSKLKTLFLANQRMNIEDSAFEGLSDIEMINLNNNNVKNTDREKINNFFKDKSGIKLIFLLKKEDEQ